MCDSPGPQVSEFLQVLEADLTRGVAGRIDSLLSQCMYFGLSFSRIGADFRPLIAPVFIRVAMNGYRRALRTAKHRYVVHLAGVGTEHRDCCEVKPIKKECLHIFGTI